MKRSRGGFSLTELLTVVAILAVLMAVAIPAVIAISRNLKMRELDDTAREIFLAAQNVLTERQAAGTVITQKADGTPIKTGEWDNEKRDGYWLLSGSAENINFLLPDGAVEPVVAENNIAIKYDPENAVVLEVYYGEKANGFASTKSKWEPEKIRDSEYSDRFTQAGHSKERKAARIGYYDDPTGVSRGGVVPLTAPTLEIVNEDELTVRVTVPKAGEYSRRVFLDVIVEELDERGVPTGNSKTFGKLPYSPLDGTYPLVLDSLTGADKQFKVVCPDITAGANIRVTAKLSAEDEKDEEGKVITRYLSASAREDTNSLFADRDENNIVSVACARHLQNLKDSFSGFACASAVNVKQTSRIDWPADECDFFSIENDCIKAYDGGKLEIRGLDAGLFNSTSENMQMEHIRIVNPIIIEGSGNVGALVNTAQNAQIDDCWIYATTIKPEKTEPQTEDFNALKTDFIVKGGTVGGLVGSATGCTITNSFAALSKVEGNTVGGLIGSASGCTVTNCYATAENLSGSQSAMFIGEMSDTTVRDCYATGNISGGSTISGFANGGAAGSITDSYCAVTYRPTDGNPLSVANGFAPNTGSNQYMRVSANIANRTGEISYGDLTLTTPELSTAQTHPYRGELDGKAYPFPAIGMPHYGSWPAMSEQLLLAYYEKYSDGSYGYHALTVNGEGQLADMNLEPGLKSDLAVAEDGYVLLSVGAIDTGTTIKRNDNDGKTVVDITDTTTFTVAEKIPEPYTHAYLMRPGSKGLAAGTSETITYCTLSCADTNFYYTPEFAKTAVNNSGEVPDAKNLKNLSVRTARQLAVLGADETGKWMAAGLSFTQELDINFEQYDQYGKLNGYKAQTAFKPIGFLHDQSGDSSKKNRFFLGTYDGNNKLITGLSITSSGRKKNDYIGLFGYVGNEGTLQDITFVSDLDKTNGTFHESRDITDGEYVGVLVGYNAGTIENCAVAGFDVSGSNYVGGFVGLNAGTISNCSAGNGYFAQKKLEGNGTYSVEQHPEVGGSVQYSGGGKHNAVGGFAGANQGTIQNSYAVVRMPQYSHGDNVGFAGNNENGTLDTVYCIAIGKTDDVDPAKGVEKRDYLGLARSGSITGGSFFLNDGTSFDTAHELKYGPASQKLKNDNDQWRGTVTTGNTHHYSNANDANQANYPFASSVTRNGARVHYGNWPLKEMNTVSLAYFEVYPKADNSGYEIGFDCKELGLNTIDMKAPVIKQDGYALLFSLDEQVTPNNKVQDSVTSGGVGFRTLFDQVTVTWKGYNGNPVTGTQRQRIVTRLVLDETESNKKIWQRKVGSQGGELLSEYVNTGSVSDFYPIQVGGKSYIPMLLETDVTTTNSYYDGENYYQKLTVTDTNSLTRTFWYNPHFALSDVAVAYGGNDMPAKPESAVIRTERQFCMLARTNNNYMSMDIPIVQDRNLKFGPQSDYVDKYFMDNSTQKTYLNQPDKVGTKENPFCGSYSGGRNTIDLAGWDRGAKAGIFGTVGRAGEETGDVSISDLTVKDIRYVIPESNHGGLVDYLYSGTMTNCTMQNVTFEGQTGVDLSVLGGLVGNAYGGQITSCNVKNVTITSDGTNKDCRQIGGIAGRVEGGTITDCSVYVNDLNGTRYVGGIVGKMSDGEISNVTVSKSTAEGAKGSIYAYKGVVGGAVGQAHIEKNGENITLADLTVQNLSVTSETQYKGGEYGTGGMIGQIYYNEKVGGAITLKGKENAENIKIQSGDTYGGIFAGNVSAKNDANYQTDFSEAELTITDSELTVNSTISDHAYGLVFGRISSNQTVKLHKMANVSGSTIQTGTEAGVTFFDLGGYVGRVEKNAILNGGGMSLSLNGATLAAGETGNVGGFAGSLQGTANGVTVSGVTVKGGTNTGGFAGLLNGTVTECGVRGGTVIGTVDRAAEEAAVDGDPDITAVGGFAGITAKGTSVKQSYSAAAVKNGLHVGGFVGVANGGTFRDCYASGQVLNHNGTEASSTGGFAGQSVKAPKASEKEKDELSAFINCFASGDVDTAKKPQGNAGAEEKFDGVGGFIGNSQAGDFQECYSVGKVTVNQHTVVYEEGTDNSHVGGFIGYGVQSGDSEQVALERIELFLNVMNNTRVVNRINASVTGEIKQESLYKLASDETKRTLLSSDFENIDQCPLLLNYISATGLDSVDGEAGKNASVDAYIGSWNSEGRYNNGKNATTTWNVWRTIQDRLVDEAHAEQHGEYISIQNALWKITGKGKTILWAVKEDNTSVPDAEMLAKLPEADREHILVFEADEDWKASMQTKISNMSGGQYGYVVGYKYDSNVPGKVVKSWIKVTIQPPSSVTGYGAYPMLSGSGIKIKEITLSATKIYSSVYLYTDTQNSRMESANKTNGAYFDDLRFVWLNRWTESDFENLAATKLPNMEVITEADYRYPVPKVFAEYVPGTMFPSGATTRRKKFNILGA